MEIEEALARSTEGLGREFQARQAGANNQGEPSPGGSGKPGGQGGARPGLCGWLFGLDSLSGRSGKLPVVPFLDNSWFLFGDLGPCWSLELPSPDVSPVHLTCPGFTCPYMFSVVAQPPLGTREQGLPSLKTCE